MKAWQWRGRREIVLCNVPEPTLRSGEVLLRPLVNGFCSTDVELICGRLTGSHPPLVPGHEIVAQVLDRRDCELPVGANVVVDTIIGCGACPSCRLGRTQICPGAQELGLTRDGGWRERLVVPARNCHLLPAQISLRTAALIEPLSCQLGLIRSRRLADRDEVLVVGSGVAAMIFAGLARAHGAGAVVVVLDDPARVPLARAFGATETIVLPERPPAGHTFSLAIDAVGSGASLELAVELVMAGGHLGLYGLAAARPPFPLHECVFKNLTISSHTSAPWLWPEAIELVAAGRLPLHSLITDRVPFALLGPFAASVLDGQPLRADRVKAVIDHD